MTASFKACEKNSKNRMGKKWKESIDNRKEQGAGYWRIRVGPLTEKSAVTV